MYSAYSISIAIYEVSVERVILRKVIKITLCGETINFAKNL